MKYPWDYSPSEIRKFLVALGLFLTTVVGVVLEAAVGLYGDGQIDAGEWLTLTVTAINAFGVFAANNNTKPGAAVEA